MVKNALLLLLIYQNKIMKKSNKATALPARRACLKFLLFMKLSFILVFITCLHAAAKTYSQETFSLHFKQVEAPKIFNAIQKQSKYRFVYNNDYINQLGKVSIDVTNSGLENILNIVLGGKFNFTINEQEMVIISPVNMQDAKETTYADSSLIKGKVLDENGKPLRGVTVSLRNSIHGVVTDDNGNFSIQAPSDAELQISYVGYKEQVYPV